MQISCCCCCNAFTLRPTSSSLISPRGLCNGALAHDDALHDDDANDDVVNDEPDDDAPTHQPACSVVQVQLRNANERPRARSRGTKRTDKTDALASRSRPATRCILQSADTRGKPIEEQCIALHPLVALRPTHDDEWLRQKRGSEVRGIRAQDIQKKLAHLAKPGPGSASNRIIVRIVIDCAGQQKLQIKIVSPIRPVRIAV